MRPPVDAELRAGAPEEALAIAELWLRSRKATPEIPPAVHSDAEVRAWFSEVVLPTREVWVTQEGDRLAAMMVLDGDWVEQLYVAADRRRRGHGSRLLAHAQATRDSLILWTFVGNAPARAFYERHGFEPDGPPSSDNEEAAPALRYRWTRRAR